MTESKAKIVINLNGSARVEADHIEIVLADGTAAACRQTKIDYILIDSSMEFDKALNAFLSKRERLF